MAEWPDVRREVKLPERLERLFHLLFSKQPAQPCLKGPTLTKQLIYFAAAVRADLVESRGIGHLLEVFAIPKVLFKIRGAQVGKGFALKDKVSVADFPGHLLARPDCRQSQTADPRHFSIPGGIERIILRPVENAVAILVQGKDPANRLFDIGLVSAEEGVVRRYEIIAIGAQDCAGLSVSRRIHADLGPVANRAESWIKTNRGIVIHALPQ